MVKSITSTASTSTATATATPDVFEILRREHAARISAGKVVARVYI